METKTAKLNYTWSFLIVEELIRQGCDFFCISPGSRSTPLTMAVANHPKAKSKIFFDERGSAFFALGYGRASEKPAVLICTSGTATANYFPAIIEAYQDGIPLIVLTADRPAELRDTGANQTIDQTKMFGGYVNWFFDLPSPNEDIKEEFILTTIDQAFNKSMQQPKGPVHINCPFREPFYSSDLSMQLETPLLKDWLNLDKPYTSYFKPATSYPSINKNIITQINNTKRGIIVAGKMNNTAEANAVKEFAQKSGWPVFADITSGLRLGIKCDQIVPYFDLLLLSDSFKNHLNPETVIQFGKRFVSKRLLNYLDETNPALYVVDNSSNHYDPNHNVTEHIIADINQFCLSVSKSVESRIDADWYKKIISGNKRTEYFLKNERLLKNKISEISIARIVSKNIPVNSALFLASSMPVRDMDMFAAYDSHFVNVVANRGASGIDGTIASAIGFGKGNHSITTLVIGDLAFIHDLNSLHLIESLDNPIIIIVINNKGGGIFSFLPIAKNSKKFEEYFGTPHHLNFKHAANLFGLDYYLPASNELFVKNYRSALKKKKSSIIEISTDRKQNFSLHKKIFAKITQTLEK